MPDEGPTVWEDAVLGLIEYPSEKLEDLVLVRSDGRPTYNFVSPLEDMLDGITHVIRARTTSRTRRSSCRSSASSAPTSRSTRTCRC